MKKILFSLILFSSLTVFSQKEKSAKMGQTTIDELLMSIYPKDSSAVAVTLYEQGNYFPHETQKNRFVTEYYFRVKILKTNGLDKGTIKIQLLNEEEISDIKATSSLLNSSDQIEKNQITNDNIVRNKNDEKIKEVIINIPNTRVGSVIEYSYKITSPYLFIKKWNFQSDIPKIKSEFSTLIPEERRYLTRLKGTQPINLKDSTEFKKCFVASKVRNRCGYDLYRMDSVKAFEPEVLMIPIDNLVSSLNFKLTWVFNENGNMLYSAISGWKEFDRKFKYILGSDEDDIRFYKRKLPKSLLKIENQLEKAKSIYYFIQNHFTWNQYLGGSISYKLRKKYKSKKGSVNLINSSLFNSLNSAGIDCKYVLLSTRGNGIPEKEVPMTEDFNYLIVKVNVDGIDYFLDATEKELKFGFLPVRALNVEARVMDFEKGSYWQKINSSIISTKKSELSLNFDETMNLNGTIFIKRGGINAFNSRKKYNALGKKKYLEIIEEEIPNTIVDNLEIQHLENLEEPIHENLKVSILNDDFNMAIDSQKLVRFSPVLFDQFSINPFKSKERNFDLDFIHQRKNTYKLTLNIPDDYKVTKLPKNLETRLPDNGASYIYKINQTRNEINLYIEFFIRKSLFSSKEYLNLKEFYEKIIIAEDAYIELQKIQE